MLAVHVERIQGCLIQAAEIHAGDLGQGTLVGIGREVFNVQLIAVGSGTTGHPCLELGEVVVIGNGLDLYRDVGVLLVERLIHLLEGLLIAAGCVIVGIGDGDGLICGRGILLLAGFGIGIAGGVGGVGRGRAAGAHQENQGQGRREDGGQMLFHAFSSLK